MTSPPPPLVTGAPVVGGAGELLGHVRTVYVDNATGVAMWAAVQGPHHTAVVPLHHSRFDGWTLQVPYDAARLANAPRHDPTTLISYPEGDDLARHYGLLPAPPADPALPSDPPRSGAGDIVMTRSQQQLQTAVNVVVGRARLMVRGRPGPEERGHFATAPPTSGHWPSPPWASPGNLHHADPTCARHGVSRRQLDISARIIAILEKLGWAYDVRWPTPRRLARLTATRNPQPAQSQQP